MKQQKLRIRHDAIFIDDELIVSGDAPSKKVEEFAEKCFFKFNTTSSMSCRNLTYTAVSYGVCYPYERSNNYIRNV